MCQGRRGLVDIRPPPLLFSLLELVALREHQGHHGPVRCLRYAPDGKTYATGSEDGTIRLWQSNISDAPATTDGAAG